MELGICETSEHAFLRSSTNSAFSVSQIRVVPWRTRGTIVAVVRRVVLLDEVATLISFCQAR
jgi:hypothetical protein